MEQVKIVGFDNLDQIGRMAFEILISVRYIETKDKQDPQSRFASIKLILSVPNQLDF